MHHNDAIAIILTLLSLLATVGWVFVLHRVVKKAQTWWLSLPECPECGGRGTFAEGREKRWSCPRCDGFGRLKSESLREALK